MDFTEKRKKQIENWVKALDEGCSKKTVHVLNSIAHTWSNKKKRDINESALASLSMEDAPDIQPEMHQIQVVISYLNSSISSERIAAVHALKHCVNYVNEIESESKKLVLKNEDIKDEVVKLLGYLNRKKST